MNSSLAQTFLNIMMWQLLGSKPTMIKQVRFCREKGASQWQKLVNKSESSVNSPLANTVTSAT